MKRKYRRHTKEILEPIVSSSQSYAECLRKLGLKVAGSNYTNLQKNIFKFNIDTSHMKHQAINKDKEFKQFEDLKNRTAIKNRMFKMFGRKCSMCGINSWLDKPVVLELDHIDGNNRDNSVSNLRLLCPNCHSTTPTWRNRKPK